MTFERTLSTTPAHLLQRLREAPLRWIFAFTAACVTMTVTGAAIAVMMSPIVAPAFGPLLRDPDGEGLHLPSLLSGYAVITLVLAISHLRLAPSGLRQAGANGLALGFAVFLGGHLVTAGWSKMPPLAMAISGVLDPFQVAVASVVFAAISRKDSAL